jgi:membrane associated rhomboid family serine protease
LYRYSYGPGLSIYGWSPMVKMLVIVNCVIFLLGFIPAFRLINIFGLVPAMVINRLYLWQLSTYMFLHGGFFHLLLNMFILWMIGSEIEGMWGSREFLKYYFITGIGAGVITVLTSWNSTIPTIGASGAIFGILVAFAMLFPNRLIYLNFFIPVKAKHLILVYVFINIAGFIGSVSGFSDSGIAHFAHLGGMLVGYVYIRGNRFFSSIFDRIKGKVQSGKIKIRLVEDDDQSEDSSSDDRVDETIDGILDKISRYGIDSLTEDEKDILNRASKKSRRKR